MMNNLCIIASQQPQGNKLAKSEKSVFQDTELKTSTKRILNYADACCNKALF